MESEIRGEILRAVHGLSLPLREAVLLRFWLGHTYREMAEILGCPVPTAQSRVRLAYQKLKVSLAQTGIAHGYDLEEAGQ
jgi:DNA-directed RNA polymerase specialized sigma24 family protein